MRVCLGLGGVGAWDWLMVPRGYGMMKCSQIDAVMVAGLCGHTKSHCTL